MAKVEREDLSALAPAEVYSRRMEVLDELGYLDLEIERRGQEKRIHLPADEWRKLGRPRFAGGSFYPIISPELGFNIRAFHVFMLETPPRTAGGKYHVHGDAVKYYLSGSGVELVGDEKYDVAAGDFVHIPAGAWHGTQNPGDEPMLVLAVEQWPGTYSQVPAPFIWGEKPKQ